MTSAGIAPWTANGIPVSTAASDQNTPNLCTDGLGGAIMAWYDYRIGNSDIFAQSVFRQDDNVPSRPLLQVPADGALVATTTPVMNWGDSVGATAYRIQVDDTWFRNPEVDATGLAASAYVVPSALLPGAYYWRVTASNPTGENASEVGEFTVDVTAPGAPGLVSPSNGAVTSDTPAFDWTDTSDPHD